MLRVKNILIAAGLLAGTLSSFAADEYSVSPFSWGVGAGWDINIPSGSSAHWDTGSGATLTGWGAMALSNKVFVASGLDVFYRTMGTNWITGADEALVEGTVKNVGLRVPLLAGLNLPLSQSVEIDLATGPQIEVNLMARHYPDPVPDVLSHNTDNSSANMFHNGFRRVSGSWRLALGFTFSTHYYVGIDSSVGFTPLASFGNRDNKIRIRGNTVAVKLCYKF